MKTKNSSFKKRFLYGWLISWAVFVVISFFTSDPAHYAGYFFGITIVSTLIALGVDKLTKKRMPLWAFVGVSFFMTLVMAFLASVGSQSN